MARVSEWHAALSDALTGGGEGELAAELHPLLGVKPYPSRQKCAELPWIAAVRALETDPQAA